jgi:RimJ/RimL family protein N-acetyltransferase
VPVAAVMVCRDRQLVQLHFCMTPRVWGVGYEVAQRFLGWFWRLHKGCREIRAAVPSHNRLTLKLARNCGFRHVSVTPNVGTRHGEPFDLHLFRMTRPEVFA